MPLSSSHVTRTLGRLARINPWCGSFVSIMVLHKHSRLCVCLVWCMFVWGMKKRVILRTLTSSKEGRVLRSIYSALAVCIHAHLPTHRKSIRDRLKQLDEKWERCTGFFTLYVHYLRSGVSHTDTQYRGEGFLLPAHNTNHQFTFFAFKFTMSTVYSIVAANRCTQTHPNHTQKIWHWLWHSHAKQVCSSSCRDTLQLKCVAKYLRATINK